jgi:hypothetical protein
MHPGSENDARLLLIRTAAYQFIKAISDERDLRGPVLDVGPMQRSSPALMLHPDLYFDLASAVRQRSIEYKSMDVDGACGADIVGDFAFADTMLPAHHFGSVILSHCLEHMPGLFLVPAVLRHVLQPDGLAYMATPWNFRFHGPRPDCWRISDDGYAALFNDASGFEIMRLDKIACPGEPLHPVAIHCIARRI